MIPVGSTVRWRPDIVRGGPIGKITSYPDPRTAEIDGRGWLVSASLLEAVDMPDDTDPTAPLLAVIEMQLAEIDRLGAEVEGLRGRPEDLPSRFDFDAALIEYQTDSTDAARRKYPELVRVWDEVDELRGATDSVSADEYQQAEDRGDHWVSLAADAAEAIDKLVAEEEMSRAVQDVLELWADLLDGRTER